MPTLTTLEYAIRSSDDAHVSIMLSAPKQGPSRVRVVSDRFRFEGRWTRFLTGFGPGRRAKMATIHEVKAEMKRRGGYGPEGDRAFARFLPMQDEYVFWFYTSLGTQKDVCLKRADVQWSSPQGVVDRIWPESKLREGQLPRPRGDDPWSDFGVLSELERRGAKRAAYQRVTGASVFSWDGVTGSGQVVGFETDQGKTNREIVDAIWPESVRMDTEPASGKTGPFIATGETLDRYAKLFDTERFESQTDESLRDRIAQRFPAPPGAERTCADCGSDMGLAETCGQCAVKRNRLVDALGIPGPLSFPMPPIPTFPGMSIVFPDMTGSNPPPQTVETREQYRELYGKEPPPGMCDPLTQQVIGIDWAYDTPEGIAAGIKSGHAPHRDCPLPGCWLCTMPRDHWADGELERRIERLGRGVRVMMHGVASVVTGAETEGDRGR